MFKHLSTEALQFQAGSPLFRDMSQVIQETLDTIPVDPKRTLFDTLVCYGKTFKNNNLYSKLTDIITQHFGFKIVVLDMGWTTEAVAFRVIQKERDAKQQHATKSRYTSESSNYAHVRPSLTFEKILDQMSRKADPDLGIVTGDLKDLYEADISIAGFLYAMSESILGVRYKGEYVAAAIIHELGHVIQDLTKRWWIYHTSMLAEDVITYVEDRVAPSDVIECLQQCLKSLNAVTPTQSVKGVKKSIQATLKGLENHSLDATACVDITKFLCKMTTALCLATKVAFTCKTSEFVTTSRNTSLEERTADEFVSRHGATAAFLERMTLDQRLSETKGIDIRFVIDARQVDNVGWGLLAADALATFKSCFKISACYVGDIYDPVVTRLETIIRDNYVVFKNPKLDSETRDYFIKQIDDASKVLEDYRSQNYVRTRQALYDVLSSIGRVSQSVLLVMFSKVVQDYTALQNFTEDLLKTPLFYQAARLQKITESLDKIPTDKGN